MIDETDSPQDSSRTFKNTKDKKKILQAVREIKIGPIQRIRNKNGFDSQE